MMDKRTEDIAEQAALFALLINHELPINPDFNGGHSEIATMIAVEAEAFCNFFGHGEVWEVHDWYEETDKWFDKTIAKVLYKDDK